MAKEYMCHGCRDIERLYESDLTVRRDCSECGDETDWERLVYDYQCDYCGHVKTIEETRRDVSTRCPDCNEETMFSRID